MGLWLQLTGIEPANLVAVAASRQSEAWADTQGLVSWLARGRYAAPTGDWGTSSLAERAQQ
ncbi:hypothetical protein J1614_012277 [Plenodomus biglobosus]|nr:hypothetical protein J1614_012277 [Plenodomus biglobosus]